MLAVNPAMIYEESIWVAQIKPERPVADEFLRAVEARLGNERFSLAQVTREEVQVGQSGFFFVKRRAQEAIVAKYVGQANTWLQGVFVSMSFGSYAKFGLYLLGSHSITQTMKSFDELFTFNAFNQICRLVLDHVVTHDLDLPDAKHKPTTAAR